MSKAIKFIAEQDRLLLKYQPSDIRDPLYVVRKLETEGRATIRKVFTFESTDLVEQVESNEFDEGERTFVFGIAEGDYFRISRRILGLKQDLLLCKQMPLTHKIFIANRDISIFGRIDALVDEPIVVGGNADVAIPLESFDELLANFPTTTELTHYARARVTGVLKDYLGTMSDAQIKLDSYLNQKKSIRNRSKIDFIKDYEPKKFEYVRDEILAMLREVEATPDAFKEKDWQRQIVEFLLLIFPKYVAVLENVHIKDFYSASAKATDRFIDLLLVDANGNVDVIEVKRPRPHQLLSRNPGSRGNYTPNGELSEAVMQVEKYLFHLSKWGRAGERVIQEKRKAELPSGFDIRITNPKAMLILGRDKDFDDRQKFDFEIIKRKYANIVDIMTYDDLLRRLDNIIAMIHHNFSKLGTMGGHA
ncbi:MAG: DUF4263 domain-containing protein [Deltaproteobacteria bacterium]|uniref:Shedu immune nuclease family protein n=1 Tax=Hydrosulfovibrio ferrireducens TaxID=2934181 RepID=UPI00121E256C|nr:MAG: DUF4263 domain-containing protein [Deltaproteobacteria bacterium]